MVTLPARVRTVDAVLAIVAFFLTLMILGGGRFGEGDARHLDALGVLLAGVASFPLAFLPRAPLALFASMSAASVTLNLIGYESGPPPGPTIALFLLAARADESRARSWQTPAVVIGAYLAHLASAGISEGRIPAEALFFGLLVWGGAWVLGDRVRMRRTRISELEERARRAERDADRERRLAAAEERTRIARDLHDSAGHAINVILVQAGAARLLQRRDPAAALVALETVEEVARETLGEIDRLVRVLREDGRERVDGAVEPPPGLAALPALADRHRAAGLEVRITELGERRALPPGVDQAAYRILQESLTNAARHGGGSAAVRLSFGVDALEIDVENPIREGADVGDGGLGIVGMRERAALLGGELDARRTADTFRVIARLPYAGGEGR
jgi:signal transduction histidine kinase